MEIFFFFLTILNDGLVFGQNEVDDSFSMGPGEFATSEMASAFKHNWVDNQEGKEPGSKSFIFCYLDKMDNSYLKMTWPNFFGRTCIFV